jgi:threonine dehydratase
MPFDITQQANPASQITKPDLRSMLESVGVEYPSAAVSANALANMPPPHLPNVASIESAASLVYEIMSPTQQFAWPLLRDALGFDVWVKHENHTPTGAFKARGGVVYVKRLLERLPNTKVLVSATRGNHGQSIALAAARNGISAIIVVPHGNSREKNAAMRALGATLIEYGDDFQAAREHATALAAQDSTRVMVPSYHIDLVMGVATYWLEFFRATPHLNVVFCPIGMGSGVNACLAVRNEISSNTLVIGVTSSHAQGFKQSYINGEQRESNVTTQLADGMAVRSTDAQALANSIAYLDGIIEVTDDEVASAMRLMFSATHQASEGAGAASLAAAMKAKKALQGLCVGVTLCGANVDSDVFAKVLVGK